MTIEFHILSSLATLVGVFQNKYNRYYTFDSAEKAKAKAVELGATQAFYVEANKSLYIPKEEVKNVYEEVKPKPKRESTGGNWFDVHKG